MGDARVLGIAGAEYLLRHLRLVAREHALDGDVADDALGTQRET